MDNETKLVKKVKRLLKKAGLPRWLHRFGPKKYEFWHHALALLVREYCKLSFRRVKIFFDLLGLTCPSKSALHYTAKRVPLALWQRLLQATVSRVVCVVAIDATTYPTSNPSFHYLKRIDDKKVRKTVKVSIAVNTRTKKILSARLRTKHVGDAKEVQYLLKHYKPKNLVADKGYDANYVHEFAYHHNIQTHIPLRKRAKHGYYRMNASKNYHTKTYHRRELVESTFGSLKRKYGTTLKSQTARTQRAEMYNRLILHNILSLLTQRFRTMPVGDGRHIYPHRYNLANKI